ncbi:hypothetical protein GSI_05907 [Ganoderma sinense ZZ0214-1]|uniref:F-box domain-containing protein n=1 Tax=Ganoderma sinense ZZ0214-1 TaxID=1077348 RepID=A0A2G8SBS4_9APHY|nr:hypothetical protein GSI_05907 [Ganoderma sinense ZZ0214-1]
MPALETLSLRQTPFEEALYVAVNFDLFPRLSTLSLINWPAPRDTAAFTSLRSLTLIGTLWPPSYDHFLDVMEHARNLEHLDLDLTVLGRDRHRDILTNLQVHQSTRKTPIVLPRLQVAKLRAPTVVLFDLFASIYAPQATTLELGNNVTYRGNEDPNPQAARILVPIVQLGYPFLRSPHSIFLRCRDGMLGVRLRSPAGSLVCFLEHQILMDDWWPTAHLRPNLLAIMDVFSVASVRALEIEGRPDRASAHTWKRVFQGFPNLCTLHVTGRGTLDSLWHGFELATTASMERDGAVCCPSLSEFTTDDRPGTYKFYASMKLFEVLLRALRTRAEHCGGRALEKLRLHLWPSKKLHNHSAKIRAGLVEDVRALVGELDYREHNRGTSL